MTIIGKLLKKIKSIFLQITGEAKILIPEAIKIVTNIKNFVDSPGCDLLTAIIPSELDNTIQDILKKYLPELLKALNTSETIANMTDTNEQLKAIVNQIQLSPNDAKDILLHGMAAKLISVISGIDWNTSASITQAVFKDPGLLT